MGEAETGVPWKGAEGGREWSGGSIVPWGSAVAAMLHYSKMVATGSSVRENSIYAVRDSRSKPYRNRQLGARGESPIVSGTRFRATTEKGQGRTRAIPKYSEGRWE